MMSDEREVWMRVYDRALANGDDDPARAALEAVGEFRRVFELDKPQPPLTYTAPPENPK